MKTPTSARFKLDKLAFFRDLGYVPHKGQMAVHLSDAPRRVVACGVRWGKSLSAAAEGLAAAMQPANRSMGWVVAPTYELADKVYREIVILAVENLRHRIITLRESDRRLVIRNLSGGVSEIRAKTADNPNSLLGEGLDWLIVDEASRLKPTIWSSYLSQRLIDKKGWAMLISTPKGRGWFYQMFRRGQLGEHGYESWNSPSWDNPHLDRELIEQQRGQLPERVFEQEYAARFVEGCGQVFRGVRECATGEFGPPPADDNTWAGLDLAKIDDFTVLIVMDRQGRVLYGDRFHRMDWTAQVVRIKRVCERYGSYLLIDSTGAGEPILEQLEDAGLAVEGYSFTAASKRALMNNLSIGFEKRDIVIPRPEVWPELVDELEAYEYQVNEATGGLRMQAPSGEHDDCVCALALAAWNRRNGYDRIWCGVL